MNIDQLGREILTKEKQLDIQNGERRNLDAKIEEMKQKIEERDENIGKKEKQIYHLKKKTQELEKFKFVLDYKIKELRKMIAPRQTEIGNLRRETKDMDAKFIGKVKEEEGWDSEMNLANPYSKAVFIVLWLYSIEPPFYYFFNEASRNKDQEQLPNFGPFAAALIFATYSEFNREDKIEMGL